MFRDTFRPTLFDGAAEEIGHIPIVAVPAAGVALIVQMRSTFRFVFGRLFGRVN